MTKMTPSEAHTVIATMLAEASTDVFNLHGRIEDLKTDYEKDPWEDTKSQIERLSARVIRRTTEVEALTLALAELPLDATRETHDINLAWKFVADSHDPYSPNRRDWSDEDIFGFVAQHHTMGLDAFKKN